MDSIILEGIQRILLNRLLVRCMRLPFGLGSVRRTLIGLIRKDRDISRPKLDRWEVVTTVDGCTVYNVDLLGL
jgi:hypothetical protein